MTPAMLRPISLIAALLALGLAGVWLLQEMDVVAWIDDPVPGMLAFAVIAIVTGALAKKGEDPAKED